MRMSSEMSTEAAPVVSVCISVLPLRQRGSTVLPFSFLLVSKGDGVTFQKKGSLSSTFFSSLERHHPSLFSLLFQTETSCTMGSVHPKNPPFQISCSIL